MLVIHTRHVSCTWRLYWIEIEGGLDCQHCGIAEITQCNIAKTASVDRITIRMIHARGKMEKTAAGECIHAINYIGIVAKMRSFDR